MRASDLVIRLQHLIRQHGDQNVYLDVDENGLRSIGEVDLDMEDTGIMIWPQETEGVNATCPKCWHAYWANGCNECPRCGHEWPEPTV